MDVGGTEVPAVVFEVLSPSSRRLDAGVKRKRYLAAGVEEVWLVDPESKGVEVHTRAGVDAAVGSDVVRSAAVPGFELVPDRLFAGPG
jgi:Uma2 family endonuclease